MCKNLSLGIAVYLMSQSCFAGNGSVSVAYHVDPKHKLHAISPFIYGTNHMKDFSYHNDDPSTTVRLGGNRMTGYNWENNASNAGSDWHQHSDNYFVGQIDNAVENVPGSVVTEFIDGCLRQDKKPLITIPACYKVTADTKGTVEEGDESRWHTNLPFKGSQLNLTPDFSDGTVYADELVNKIVSTSGKGHLYAVDNEPDLWDETHPHISPQHISCRDFINRSIDFSKAIKSVDDQATIFGFVSFGFSGFLSFHEAPDWKTEGAAYPWFIDYYLDKMAMAENSEGKRLVDVLDLHWYPECRGDKRIIDQDANSAADKKARLQAYRSLWDSTYTENSWIAKDYAHFLPLIPRIKESIDKYYPGTKLAFTEFQYGGYDDLTGAISLADVLGTFGKYNVWAAYHWGHPGIYGIAAYNLYCNYDGKHSGFGDTAVESSVADWENTSVYSSLKGDELHLIITNKYDTDEIAAAVNIAGEKSYSHARVYQVCNSPKIEDNGQVAVKDNLLSLSIPPMSVVHVVLN